MKTIYTISLFALLAPLTCPALTLFDFNTKPTFFHFQNSETTVALSLADESALPASKSLQAKYEFAGDQAYIGLAIDFKHLAPKQGQWETFTGLTVVAKAAEPTKLVVQLIVAGKTYSTTLEITKNWTRFTVPFTDFKLKDGGSFDPKTMKIDRLALRPGRKPNANTLLVDEITLEETVSAAKQEPVTPTK
ncbi:MAG: hypothetical protein PCFJNLEI_01009 [Verrucomicrobiae bacterium]|nr:hypothetical protein [Verrucomicrobiae bacterium]